MAKRYFNERKTRETFRFGEIPKGVQRSHSQMEKWRRKTNRNCIAITVGIHSMQFLTLFLF